MTTKFFPLWCGVVISTLLLIPSAQAQMGAADGEWRTFGGDIGGTKYTPLSQIDASNVNRLQIAWQRPIVDEYYLDENSELSFSNNYPTLPLVVDGVAFIPNGIGLVEAFDPGTGETIWVQEPPVGEELAGVSTRGVAYWSDGTNGRILVQRGQYMYALDAETGELYADFGDSGRVDLRTGLAAGAFYRWGGAPLVVRDVVVVGHTMSDTFATKEAIRGDVRAFDVRTGALTLGVPHYSLKLESSVPTLGKTTHGLIRAMHPYGRCSAPMKISVTSTCRSRQQRVTCMAATGLATICSVRASSRWTQRPGKEYGTSKPSVMACGITIFPQHPF